MRISGRSSSCRCWRAWSSAYGQALAGRPRGARVVASRFLRPQNRRWRPVATLAAVALVAGCASWEPPRDGPRGSSPRSVPAGQTLPAPPIYEVRRGDTLYSIAFRFGLDWRDVSGWNNISAPYTIRPGQELRLSRPPQRRPVAAVPETTPPVTAEPDVSDPAPEPTAPATGSRPPRPVAAPRSGPGRTVSGVRWQWPTGGDLLQPFDPAATRRGIAIGGREGQPVVAAAAGEVVYSGTGLIGYGELIIVKHSDTMLSAYGHNRRRLVEEGDRIGAGQAIAEMGRNERDEVVLHFEIRRDGEPVNPLGFLPEGP